MNKYDYIYDNPISQEDREEYERQIMHYGPYNLEEIRKLHDIGLEFEVELHSDGTGYVSVGYMGSCKGYPFSNTTSTELKTIPQQFVLGMLRGKS